MQPKPSVPDEAGYLKAVRRRGGFTAENDDGTLLSMGGNLCLMLSYYSMGQQLEITTPVLTGARASGDLKLAVNYLCPELDGVF